MYKVLPKEVEPIKNPKDIQKIKQYLQGKALKRDYALFVLGINIGLRASDLLKLTIGDVAEKERNKFKVKKSVEISEKKTGRRREFQINQSAKEAIELFLNNDRREASEEEYLFQSRKGDNQPLQVRSLHRLIKSIMRDLGVKGNFGTHTLRKTFAYHVYANNIKDDPGILDKLCKVLNHSSASITLRYIGITKEVIADIYNSLNL